VGQERRDAAEVNGAINIINIEHVIVPSPKFELVAPETLLNLNQVGRNTEETKSLFDAYIEVNASHNFKAGATNYWLPHLPTKVGQHNSPTLARFFKAHISRQKRCDLSQPYCERCIKGGRECLGYEEDKDNSSVDRGLSMPTLFRSRPTFPVVPVGAVRSETGLPMHKSDFYPSLQSIPPILFG
jgi:hypothetical protein